MNKRDLDNYITGHHGEDQFRNEHDEDCECRDCVEHEDDCECEECYERLVIEADRARADYIWESNVAANARMANLMGFDEEEEQ